MRFPVSSRRASCRNAVLAEAIRLGIPELIVETQTCENNPHLLWLGTPRILLQASRVPCGCKRPELVHPHERPQGVPVCRTPIANSLFRPEEQHVISREDDIVPPLCRGNKAAKEQA